MLSPFARLQHPRANSPNGRSKKQARLDNNDNGLGQEKKCIITLVGARVYGSESRQRARGPVLLFHESLSSHDCASLWSGDVFLWPNTPLVLGNGCCWRGVDRRWALATFFRPHLATSNAPTPFHGGQGGRARELADVGCLVPCAKREKDPAGCLQNFARGGRARSCGAELCHRTEWPPGITAARRPTTPPQPNRSESTRNSKTQDASFPASHPHKHLAHLVHQPPVSPPSTVHLSSSSSPAPRAH